MAFHFTYTCSGCFAKALEELIEEGGIHARYKRYAYNNHLLRSRLSELGLKAYISEELQSPIITTFLFPHKEFSFEHFYQEMKRQVSLSIQVSLRMSIHSELAILVIFMRMICLHYVRLLKIIWW